MDKKKSKGVTCHTNHALRWKCHSGTECIYMSDQAFYTDSIDIAAYIHVLLYVTGSNNSKPDDINIIMGEILEAPRHNTY